MFAEYVRREMRLIILFFGVLAIFTGVLFLYALPLEAVAYTAVLGLLLFLFLFFRGYRSYKRRRVALQHLAERLDDADFALPETNDALEEEYRALLRDVCKDRLRLRLENRCARDDLVDYYTVWAHQIKTPIAAAHLLIEQGGSGEEIDAELLRIQQYTDMALGYLRLDSDSTDYVFAPVELDALLRQSVRKLARLFVLRKIRLELEETNRTVLSDEKWLGFVIEQIISNALKYTPSGGTIRIFSEGDALVIADNGIGIRPEDLPRVFEKGFTGANGRWEKKSTGIGLYLARRTMQRLNHTIAISSEQGKGTAVRLDLGRDALETE